MCLNIGLGCPYPLGFEQEHVFLFFVLCHAPVKLGALDSHGRGMVGMVFKDLLLGLASYPFLMLL